MDNTSTHEFNFNENLLRAALKGCDFPAPLEHSLNFIRNFARNFRVCKEIDGRAQEFVLN